MDPRPPAPPAAALTALLPPDVDLGRGWRDEGGATAWYGVVWGRLGRGDLAARHLDLVATPSLRPWLAAERGRLVRELGLHAQAEAFEAPALADAVDPVDRAMLEVSLTADAVGTGDVELATSRLARARATVGALDAGDPRAARQRLRLTWVEVEVAFLAGRPPPTAGLPVLEHGTVRWPDAIAWGSDFHRAKALLFAGIVHGDARLLDRSAASAPPVLRWAVELARADQGRPGALDAARAAWAALVPLPGYGTAVAATPTARRLRGSPDPEGVHEPSRGQG